MSKIFKFIYKLYWITTQNLGTFCTKSYTHIYFVTLNKILVSFSVANSSQPDKSNLNRATDGLIIHIISA